MKKKKACYEIKDGLFFPSDFKKMDSRAIIYIKAGKLIFLDDLECQE